MQNRQFGKQAFEVSAFGMGCMRLPKIIDEKNNTSEVDKEKAIELIRYAADHGVTYFDTAYGYHHQQSEAVLGEALDGGYRKKVRIATKQPFGVMKTQDDIRRNLENTLKKLRTDYLDVYLIHGLAYGQFEEIKKRKIIEEYEKFKAEGLIKAIAFSFHGSFENFKEIVSYYPWDMTQIQQNLIDTDKQATEEGIRFAGERGCAVVIMEPLRGGSLASPPEAVRKIYDSYPQKRSPVEWAFRHMLNYPQVSVILSGVTTLEQLKEDIEIFSKPDALPNALSSEEQAILKKVKAQYESVTSVRCTGCEYCLPCPNGVNIPGIFARYNDGVMFSEFSQAKRGYSFFTNSKSDASQCKECKECEAKCPQHLEIIESLKTAHEALKGWIE